MVDQASPLAELLMQEEYGLLELRKRAGMGMLTEARRHQAAQLLPIVVTSYPLKNKRSFWA